MIIIGTYRAYNGETYLFSEMVTSPRYRNRKDSVTKDMFGIFLYLLMTVFGLCFSYFAFDFLDDFIKGVTANQTTVENYKDIWGINNTKRQNHKIFIGETWYDYLLPLNIKKEHNFLELTYKQNERSYKKQLYEMTLLKTSKMWQKFYYDRYSYIPSFDDNLSEMSKIQYQDSKKIITSQSSDEFQV